MAAVNLRDVLSEELATRTASAPGYSLRKFAAELEVSPAQLSKVLSGKSTLSEEKISKISVKLNWSEEFTQTAIRQVRNRGRKPSVSAVLGRRSAAMSAEQVEAESVAVFSNAYHFGILELIHSDDFVPDLKFISARLGIDLVTTQNAVHRLVDLNLLSVEADGSWLDRSKSHELSRSRV